MIHAFAEKKVAITPPAAILDDTSAATTVIDTYGYDYLVVDVIIGATDIAMTALKLQEDDALNGANLDSAADITGAIYGTSANDTGSTSTLPSADSDNDIFTFFVDLRGRKRYIDLVATMGDGTAGGYVAALATLSRAKEAPSSAVEAGYVQRLVL